MSDSEDMQVDEALLPSVEEAQKKLNAAEVALAAKQEEVDKKGEEVTAKQRAGAQEDRIEVASPSPRPWRL